MIYGITPAGDLQWYRHDGWTDGTNRWTAGAGGNNVSGGWGIYSTVFSGGGGVIYGITPAGDLQWYRHDGWTDGTNRWTAGAGGNNIGGGWNMYGTVFGDTAESDGGLVGSLPPPPGIPVDASQPAPPQDQGGSAIVGASSTLDPQKPLTPLRLPRKPGGVISYRRVVCDATGALRAYEGQVPVATDKPIPVGPLDFIGESFSYKYSFVDETGALRVSTGEVTATAQGRVQVGTVKLGGSVEGKKLRAQGSAEFVTAGIEGSGSGEAHGASGSADGHVTGPAARGLVGIGLDGGGAQVGVSAGEIGGRVGVTIGGRSSGVGGGIALKAEPGLRWGTAGTIKLPLLTISGPNPLAGVTSFAATAVTDLVRDPLRTAEKAMSDILGVGRDAVEAAGQVVESITDAVDGWFGDDEEDRNVVTTDRTRGPSPRFLPPGAVIID
ncbi:tachylectin-related carbohydrate-binding protein [Streptomyces sp. NPDC096079]|uniref:tachylectin-related carbohydrate-binding protein n=1 Tax=Streptomyces sp. NPDC096079 TaxID=3155820 RepID=UPI003333D62C